MAAQPPFEAPSTLGQIVDRLGSTLLTLEAGQYDPQRTVTRVVVHDPADPPEAEIGAIVLGVGIVDQVQLEAAVRRYHAAGAAALIVREPVPSAGPGPEPLALFGLVRGAAWIHVATMLDGVLRFEAAGDATASAVDTGADLFALAESLAELLRAPVTIEDLSSRVLAFSADQAGTDDGRRLTILGLKVPKLYSDVVRHRGIFRQIYASDRPVFMREVEPGAFPRVAIRVKAGEEVLGSIWAVVREPLSVQREQGMIEAARVVALTMLRARVSADASQRLRLGLVSMLLEGGARAREASRQLGLGSAPLVVVAFGDRDEEPAVEPEPDADSAHRVAATQRAARALATYLQPIHPRAISALIGRVAYVVLPQRVDGVAEATLLASAFLERIDDSSTWYAGVGSAVPTVDGLPDSRREADAALRVLHGRRRPEQRVADFASIQVEALLLRVADAVAADRVQLAGPLAVLADYDREHASDLRGSLVTWLEHFGDVAGAAQSMHVHKNTFRYRLARIAELTGADLADPDARFGLMLQARIFDDR